MDPSNHGVLVLKDILEGLGRFEADDIVYVSVGAAVDADTPILVVSYMESKNGPPEGMRYLLETGVMREVLQGTTEQVGGALSLGQQVLAIVHYAEHDAYVDAASLARTG